MNESLERPATHSDHERPGAQLLLGHRPKRADRRRPVRMSRHALTSRLILDTILDNPFDIRLILVVLIQNDIVHYFYH